MDSFACPGNKILFSCKTPLLIQTLVGMESKHLNMTQVTVSLMNASSNLTSQTPAMLHTAVGLEPTTFVAGSNPSQILFDS